LINNSIYNNNIFTKTILSEGQLNVKTALVINFQSFMLANIISLQFLTVAGNFPCTYRVIIVKIVISDQRLT